MSTTFTPGTVIHGFAYGAFGRDSYACRRVEAVGPDWIVTRNARGEVEMAWGQRMPSPADAADRSWCSEACPYSEGDVAPPTSKP